MARKISKMFTSSILLRWTSRTVMVAQPRKFSRDSTEESLARASVENEIGCGQRWNGGCD